MGRYELIRAGLDNLNGGQFQVLAQRYITAKYGYASPHYLGTKSGTEETTKGTPDGFWPLGDGKYVFVECGHYTTSKSSARKKIENDIKSCLNYEAENIERIAIEKIVICHGVGRFEPNDISELENLDERVVLIGPDQIAEDLYSDFPGLAKEYLGLEFDSNQVLEPEAFVRQLEEDAYAPSMRGDLIGRDNELNRLLEAIENSKIIVISGKSGCGKTKLAFEACKAYSARCNASCFVIRSRRRPIYEDLRTYFGPGRDYVVLVDDANDVNGLDDLVDFVLSYNNVRFVLTVRNYAAEEVYKAVGRLGDSQKLELGQLGYEEMIRICRAELDPQLIGVAERIVEKSRGNIRLICLAAQSANLHGTYAIENIKHLLELCYGNKLLLLSEDERKTAGIASIVGAHKTEGNEALTRFEQLAGISHERYKAACNSLHDKELLDGIHGIAAVSFEEQNIRDYLIFDAICVSRWIKLADIYSIDQGQRKMKYTLNVLTDVFGDEQTVAEIKRQMYLIWDSLETSRKWDLAREFGALLGQRVLSMIVQRVNERLVEACEWSDDCFSLSMRNHYYEHEEMSVLGSFFGTRYAKQAVEVLLIIAEKGIASSKDLKKCFYELACSLKTVASGCDFNENESCFEMIIRWCGNEPSRIFCFLSFVEGIMDDRGIHAQYPAHNSNDALESILISGDDLLNMRRKCVEVLRSLQGISKMHQSIRDILLGYQPGWIGYPNYETAVETIDLLLEEYIPFFDPVCVGDYEKLLRFANLSERYHCAIAPIEEKLNRSKSCNIMVMMMKKEHDLESRDCDIEKLGISLQVDEYESLFAFFNDLGLSSQDSWWVSYSLKIMMLALSEADSARFEHVCLSYLENGLHPDIAGQVVVDYMNEKLGAKGVRAWCVEHATSSLDVWLHLCNVSAIITGFAGEVSNHVLEEFDKANRPLHFEYIFKCELQSRGFMPKYYEKVFEWAERHGYFPDWTLLFGSQEIESSLLGLSDEPVSIQALEKALLKKLEWDASSRNAYYDSGLVGGLISVDPAFGVVLARFSTAIGACEVLEAVGKAMRSIDVGEESFHEVAHVIFDAKSTSALFYAHNLLLHFIMGFTDDENRDSVTEWMAQTAVNDDDFGEFVREVARALSFESKKTFVLKACQKGLDVRLLGEACCGMSFKGESWSGSYVPVLRRKIVFLDDLESQMSDLNLIEYKLEIARLKEVVEQRIYEVEEREFIGW